VCVSVCVCVRVWVCENQSDAQHYSSCRLACLIHMCVLKSSCMHVPNWHASFICLKIGMYTWRWYVSNWWVYVWSVCAEYRLFYRSLLQKRPTILSVCLVHLKLICHIYKYEYWQVYVSLAHLKLVCLPVIYMSHRSQIRMSHSYIYLKIGVYTCHWYVSNFYVSVSYVCLVYKIVGLFCKRDL